MDVKTASMLSIRSLDQFDIMDPLYFVQERYFVPGKELFNLLI